MEDFNTSAECPHEGTRAHAQGKANVRYSDDQVSVFNSSGAASDTELASERLRSSAIVDSAEDDCSDLVSVDSFLMSADTHDSDHVKSVKSPFGETQMDSEGCASGASRSDSGKEGSGTAAAIGRFKNEEDFAGCVRKTWANSNLWHYTWSEYSWDKCQWERGNQSRWYDGWASKRMDEMHGHNQLFEADNEAVPSKTPWVHAAHHQVYPKPTSFAPSPKLLRTAYSALLGIWYDLDVTGLLRLVEVSHGTIPRWSGTARLVCQLVENGHLSGPVETIQVESGDVVVGGQNKFFLDVISDCCATWISQSNPEIKRQWWRDVPKHIVEGREAKAMSKFMAQVELAEPTPTNLSASTSFLCGGSSKTFQ